MSTRVENKQTQRRAKLLAAQKLVSAGLSTADHKQQYKELIAEADLLEVDIRNLQRIEKVIGPSPAAPAVNAVTVVRSTDAQENTNSKNTRLLFAEGLRNTLRTGGKISNMIETRDITEAGNSGALVPQGFVDQAFWTDALREVSPIAALVKNKTYSGGFQPIRSPAFDATSVSALYLPESGSTSKVNSTVAGSVTSGTFLPGETVTQSKSSPPSATVAGNTSSVLALIGLTGTANGSNTWVGQTSGAVFTPSAAPVAVSSSTVNQTPTLFSKIVNGDNLVAVTTVSWQEWADADGLENWLRSVAAVIMGRAQELAILQAVSADGFALSNATALASNATVAVTTAALADGLSYDNFINLKGALNRAYRYGPGGGFIVNETTETYLAGLLDGFGRPYYNRDPQTQNLLIDGSQVYVTDNAALAPLTTGSSIPALFGDYSRAMQTATSTVRFQVLQPAPETLTSNVVMSMRFGSALLLSGAVAALETASS